MPTGDIALFLMGLVMADVIGAMAGRVAECRAIEQATIDREFWELVNE